MQSSKASQTVFMTPEESERVRNIAKQRWERCRDLQGAERVAVEPKSLSQEVVGADLMADMLGPSKDDKMPAIAVGSFYPPCVESLEDLKPMKLSELQMETHHSGKYLSLKCNAAVIQAAAYCWTIVEEKSTREAERLHVYLPTSRLKYILDEGDDFVIKEPYYTLNDQGAPTIRVDHPSDMILAAEQDDSRTTTKWKDLGNAALKKRDLWKAHACYTQGLAKHAKSEESIAHDIHRNRSHVNLLLARFSEAKSDALAALTNRDDPKAKELDSKAYFRAGRAAYALAEFDEARRLFDEQLKLAPGDKDAQMYLKWLETRKEELDGKYDFDRIGERMYKTGRPRADVASFTKHTEVRGSPGAGRGLFATKDFERAEVVIVEKAFCSVWGREPDAWTAMTYDDRDDRIRVAAAGLRKAVVEGLSNNYSEVEKAMDLFGDYKSIGKEVIVKDGEPAVDVFQVHDIVSRNAFGVGQPEEDIRRSNTAIWIWAAYVNHACVPNVRKEHMGDVLILRAIRKIRKGEELFHSYDEHPDHATREAALMTTWGFKCSCRVCKVEEQEDPALWKKRKDLFEEATAVIQSGPADRVKKAKIARIVDSIAKTYDNEKYSKDLPRLGVVEIHQMIEVTEGWERW